MKHLFLFLAISTLTLSAISCSKSDEKSSISNSISMGTLKCEIDGVSKTFSNVTATNSNMAIVVEASNGTSVSEPTETISFVIKSAELGSNAIEMFTYHRQGWDYRRSDNFMLNVTTNDISSKALKGTFQGNMEEFTGNMPSKIVTNGTFDIKYE